MSCQKDKLIPKLIIVSIIMTIIEKGKMPDTYLITTAAKFQQKRIIPVKIHRNIRDRH